MSLAKLPLKSKPGKVKANTRLDRAHQPTSNQKDSTGGQAARKGGASMHRHDAAYGVTAKKPENDDKTIRKTAPADKRARVKRLTQTKL